METVLMKAFARGAVALVLIALPAGAWSQEGQSIWDGVYTQEQADRGEKLNAGVCAKCHGVRGDGANEPDQPGGPAIARFSFLRKWDGSSIAALYDYIRMTMPPDNPQSRSDQEYLDVIAHLLALSGAPAGATELPLDPEALNSIVIEQKPE
jgi:cytochrome c